MGTDKRESKVDRLIRQDNELIESLYEVMKIFPDPVVKAAYNKRMGQDIKRMEQRFHEAVFGI